MAATRPPPRLFVVLVAPLQAFLRTEAKGGILLLLAALAAFGLANSPLRAAWHQLWTVPLGVSLGAVHLTGSLHFVVDDVLMAVFFFVVGLEIKRELVRGELRTPRQALLPALAAVGGMLSRPFSMSPSSAAGRMRGWAIPMATDIAFSIGCLALLGERIPHGLKVFLTALAIFDDIGGILVIALFYGTGIQPLASSSRCWPPRRPSSSTACASRGPSCTSPPVGRCGGPSTRRGSTPPWPEWCWGSSSPRTAEGRRKQSWRTEAAA